MPPQHFVNCLLFGYGGICLLIMKQVSRSRIVSVMVCLIAAIISEMLQRLIWTSVGISDTNGSVAVLISRASLRYSDVCLIYLLLVAKPFQQEPNKITLISLVWSLSSSFTLYFTDIQEAFSTPHCIVPMLAAVSANLNVLVEFSFTVSVYCCASSTCSILIKIISLTLIILRCILPECQKVLKLTEYDPYRVCIKCCIYLLLYRSHLINIPTGCCF